MDNKVNDLCYVVKFENHIKNKRFIKQNISFLENQFFFICGNIFLMSPKNSIASAFFLPRQILKNIDMPRQKPQQSTAEANSECCMWV